jgi:hypothetical protein
MEIEGFDVYVAGFWWNGVYAEVWVGLVGGSWVFVGCSVVSVGWNEVGLGYWIYLDYRLSLLVSCWI